MANKKPNNLTVDVTVGSEVVNDGSTMEIAENEAYLQSFPPGYRFAPRDDELIEHYLQCKIANRPLPISKIRDVNICRFNPQDLAVMCNAYGDREKEWYFFTPRDRKYPNGNRPNRAAGNGYWKATGADKEIHSKASNLKVGYRKALVFYEGTPPKGTKTKWIMHEYRVDHESPRGGKSAHGMRLDDWVLCRIYHKTNAPNSKGHTNKKKTLALPNSEEDGPIWNPASESDEYSPEPENWEPIFVEDGRDELNMFCDGFDGQFYGSYCGPIIPSSKTDESLALTDMNCIEFSPLSVVSKLYQNQVCQDSYYDPLSGDELLLNTPTAITRGTLTAHPKILIRCHPWNPNC